jgi:hypothetical protein
MKKTWKIKLFSILILTMTYSVYGAKQEIKNWTYSNGNYQLEWNVTTDKSRMFQIISQNTIWQGSLLPAFWLLDSKNQKRYLKSVVLSEAATDENNETKFMLQFADLGTGSISVKKESWGISITDFYVKWNDKIPEIIDLYFGTSSIPAGRQSLMDEQNPSFSSDWEALGYCIPGAKEGTVQSYFRMWDFGQTNIALGNFGPSMGAPYGAAFPRPILALAMGNDQGWMVLGAGSIPEAPMTLKIRSSLGCINFLYREDLWGAGAKERHWKNPLRITFGENAWLAYRQYFNTFPEKEAISPIHQKAIWNTWGNWRNKEFPIRPMSDFAKQAGAEIFVIDDPWEASKGIGEANTTLFPDIQGDLEYIHQNNMSHGIWETLGWIGDTAACGLSKADLICDRQGNPCIGSWNFNPFAPGYFCIDISSQPSRDFLKKRTINTMKTMKPKLIKLDFGYGLPDPNMGVPRNPELRGEKYSFELMKLIVESAKSVDPDVTIMYYGINPLYLPLVDMISLDDQGDMWNAIKEGHDQWSIWASLLCYKQVANSGSSSYDWHTDDEVILNTFILGSPGAVLGTHLDDGSPVPEKYLNRRFAINKWYRKSIEWQPVWLNSQLGNMQSPPKLNCWARTESINGKNKITALVLRGNKDKIVKELDAFEWDGRWAVVSQDNKGILEAGQFAVVPFDAGFISIKLLSAPAKIEKVNIRESVPLQKWDWKDGILTIRVDEKELSQVAGFIIDLKN